LDAPTGARLARGRRKRLESARFEAGAVVLRVRCQHRFTIGAANFDKPSWSRYSMRVRHCKEGGGAMAKDLTVFLEDRPGMLAELGEATGKAGVNIEGICALTFDGRGVLHILVEDAAAARSALADAGVEVRDERDVLVLELEDRPGTLGEIARNLSEASVNIELAYTTFGGVQLVLGVDKLEQSREAMQKARTTG
jgi:hypothetical protein